MVLSCFLLESFDALYEVLMASGIVCGNYNVTGVLVASVYSDKHARGRAGPRGSNMVGYRIGIISEAGKSRFQNGFSK